MRRFLLFLFILFLGFKTGLVAQVATIQSEKVYPNNTRTCYFEINIPPSEQQKAFVMAEAKHNSNLDDLYFYSNSNLVMFTSVAQWTLESVVNFINDALSHYPGEYRIKSITEYTPLMAQTYSTAEQPVSIFADEILEMDEEPLFSEDPQFVNTAMSNAPQRSPRNAPPIYPAGGDPCEDITEITDCGFGNVQRVIFDGRGYPAFENTCTDTATLGQEKIFSFTAPVAMEVKFVVPAVTGNFKLLLLQGSNCLTDVWQCKDVISGKGVYANLGVVSAGTTVYFMLDAIDTTETEISFYIPCANSPCSNITHINSCRTDMHVTFRGEDDTEWGSSSCTGVSTGQKKVFSFTASAAMEIKLSVTSLSGGKINLLYLKNGDCHQGLGQWVCKESIAGRAIYYPRTGESPTLVPANTTIYFMLEAVDTVKTEISFYIQCLNETLCDFAEKIGCCQEEEQSVTFVGTGDAAWMRNPCAALSTGKEAIYKIVPTTAGYHHLVVTSAVGGYINYFYKDVTCTPPVLTAGNPATWNWTCVNGSRGIDEAGRYLIGYLQKGKTYYLVLDATGTSERTQSFYIDCPNDVSEDAEEEGGGDAGDCAPLSQPNGCVDAKAFCTSNQYCFPASTTNPGYGTVGCLYSTPNPAWYWMKIGTPGDLVIRIEQRDGGTPRDVDFVAWGPFNTREQACAEIRLEDCPSGVNCRNNTSSPGDYPTITPPGITDCSYDPAAYEYFRITNAQKGQIYVLLLTNYSRQPGNITFERDDNRSTATSDCNIVSAQAGNNGPLCVGDTLELMAAAKSAMCSLYNWRGPNGFTSTEQNPKIPNVTLQNAGRYSLQIISGGVANPNIEETYVAIGAPSDTTFIYDTICSNKVPYIKYGFNVREEGRHVRDLKTNAYAINNDKIPHCDSVVVLNLVINPTSRYEYWDTICFGDSILFNGKYVTPTAPTAPNVPKVYNGIAINWCGCDSTLKLNLTVKATPVNEYWPTICVNETYTWNGENYTYSTAGTRQVTQSYGCDSTVKLNFTVKNVNEKTITQSVCIGDTYDFYGTIIEITASGDFTHYHTVTVEGSCDTVVTLILQSDSCSGIENLKFNEICADDEYIVLNFTVTEGELTCYTVKYETKAINAGFENIVCAPIVSNNHVEIPIPQFSGINYVLPDNYKMDIVFYFSDGTYREIQGKEFTVLYPSWVIQQKWNDVLALQNEDYNGGYVWSTYEWYKSNVKIEDTGNKAYIYIPNDNYLDFNAEYRANLTRVGENYGIMTCYVIPQQRNCEALPVILPSMAPSNSSMGIKSQESGTITIYSVSGIVISRQNLQAGENTIQTPAQQGFYIMVVEEKNQEPVKQVLVVK